MTVPTTIVNALLSVLATGVANVDATSSTEFTPAITATVAALSPAFELESRYVHETLGDEMIAEHRIPIEFWIKHAGAPATTMQRARDIGAAALAALVQADGTGYHLAFDDAVTFTVDPGLTTVNSASWLVATMFVTVRDALTVT